MRQFQRTANCCQVVIHCPDAVTVNSNHIQNPTPHQRTNEQRQLLSGRLARQDDGDVILSACTAAWYARSFSVDTAVGEFCTVHLYKTIATVATVEDAAGRVVTLHQRQCFL